MLVRWSLSRCPVRAAAVFLLAAATSAPAFGAIVVEFQDSDVTIIENLADSDMEDPATVQGRLVLEFRDADSGGNPDWTATGTVDGTSNQAWLRDAGAEIQTTTTVAGRAVSIHLQGDSNDGRCDVFVGGVRKATLDMNDSPGTNNVQVIVDGLAKNTYTIRVDDLGDSATGTGNDDCAVWGAAVLLPKVSTFILHGFQLGTGAVPEWAFTMAEEVLRQAGDASGCNASMTPLGTVLRYVPVTFTDGMGTHVSGTFEHYCGSTTPNGPIVYVMDWARESDAPNQGGTQGYSEAAADAFYAALRDPKLPAGFEAVVPLGVNLHFIAHSRGTAVSSELIERLAVAGITVDHMTTLDPHPVNGTLADEAFLGLDWGDDVPQVWTDVTFADNYYREDGGGDLHSEDFDGMALSNIDVEVPIDCSIWDLGVATSVADLDLLPSDQEHVKIHAWYHGTIDTSASDDGTDPPGPIPIDPMGDEDWYGRACVPARTATGYAYSLLDDSLTRPASGSRETPGAAGTSPSAGFRPTTVYNGNFEVVNFYLGLGHAGWRYQGGDKTGADPWEPGILSCDHWAQLSSDTTTLTHNWQYIDSAVDTISLFYRVVAAGNDTLRLRLIDETGSEVAPLGSQSLGSPTDWQKLSFTIPVGVRGGSHRLQLELDLDGAGSSVVDLDDISYSSGPATKPAPRCPLLPAAPGWGLWILLGLLLLAGVVATHGGARSSAGA